MARVRASPLRSGATITAVAVAVTFLIIVSSISVGLEGATERELLDYTVGTPELPISDFIQTEEGDFVGLFAPRLLDAEEVDSMRSKAQVWLGSASQVRVYPYSERVLGKSIFSGLDYTVGRLMAVDPSLGITTPYTSYHSFMGLSQGSHLSDPGGRDVVLGYQLWVDRFPGTQAGDMIDLSPEGTAWFETSVSHLRQVGPQQLVRLPSISGVRLMGVLDRDLSTDHNAFVPIGMFANETGAGQTARGPRCEAVSVEVRQKGVDMTALALELGTQTTRISSFFVTSEGEATSTELAEGLRSSIYSWLILAMAVIMVGMVLGVANTTFLSVSQRIREIGTLRALGFSSDQIKKLITWEALFLGMMGGTIGFFTGHILTSSILTVLFEIEGLGILLAPGRTVPIIVLGSIIAVLAASLVGAWLPARRAADLSPVEALSSPM
jgi:putative ABC transport system permease protein